MNKFRLIDINIICIFSLLLITLLSWQYLRVSTHYLQSDYAVFYKILHRKNKIYHTYYVAVILGVENTKGKKSIKYVRSEAVNLNTPLMTILIQKLVNISDSLNINALIWVLVSLLGAGISLFILLRTFGVSQAYYFFPSFLLLCLSWPSLYNFASGQVSYILFPLLSLSFYLSYTKRWAVMSIVLALLASLKLFFLIFLLFFILQRQWRFVWLYIFSFFIFFFMPVLYYSWNEYHNFFQLTQSESSLIRRSLWPFNGSILGFISNISYIFKLNFSAMQIKLSAAILSAYVIIQWLVYDHCVLRHLPKYKNELRFSFLIVLALLCSPLGWAYYFVYLLIPVVILFAINERYKLSKSFYICFFIALVLPFFSILLTTDFISNLIRQFSVFIDLLFWLACMYMSASAIRTCITKSHQSSVTMTSICVSYVLIGLIPILFNLHLSHFFSLDPETYLKNVTPSIWISK